MGNFSGSCSKLALNADSSDCAPETSNLPHRSCNDGDEVPSTGNAPISRPVPDPDANADFPGGNFVFDRYPRVVLLREPMIERKLKIYNRAHFSHDLTSSETGGVKLCRQGVVEIVPSESETHRFSSPEMDANPLFGSELIGLPKSEIVVTPAVFEPETTVNKYSLGQEIFLSTPEMPNILQLPPDDECSCDETMDSSDLMTTDVPYYTMTGCAPPDILNEKDITTDKLEIPSWRHKVFTSCYSMEGTENLSDDVFEKRHARLEQEEKRRKRWDVQRIREQRQLDHLRENERKRNWLAKSDDEGEKERQRVCSLYPNVSGTTRISIDESLPVNALGVVLKRVEPREFSLPWKDGNTSCGFSYDKDTFTIKTRRK